MNDVSAWVGVVVGLSEVDIQRLDVHGVDAAAE